MRLEYIFIEDYRALKNQGFDLSNQFMIDYNHKTRKLTIQKSEFYIENFFGENILSLTGIVGENGVGKTTVLNFIKENLSLSKSSTNNQTNCLVIFFNKEQEKFIVVDNLEKSKNSEVSKNIDISNGTGFECDITKFSDFKPYDIEEDEFNSKYTFLESIPGLNDLGIVYLSNVFDYNRPELDYGPIRSPYVFNLSTNFLLKSADQDFLLSTFTSEENKRIIKYVINTKELKPQIKLPEAISLIFNFGIARDILDEMKGNKEYVSDAEMKIFLEGLTRLDKNVQMEQPQKEQVRFWLLSNLFIEIFPFLNQKYINNFLARIDTQSIDSFQISLFSTLESSDKDLQLHNYKKLKNSRRLIHFPNDFWNEYLEEYKELMNTVFILYDRKLKKKDNFNIFSIPLSSSNYDDIRKLFDLLKHISISKQIISFNWRQLSTGESIMLAFFSRLYELSESRLFGHSKSISQLWFLLDESDSHFHPQWQKQFIKLLTDWLQTYFADYNCQVILTSHSPLLISDIPKKNLVFLKKGKEGNTIVQRSLNDHKQTFAANINTLFSDSFFIQDGLIGDFADGKINHVIDLLIDGSIDQIIEERDFIESVINIIGEPVIKVKLLSLLENRMRANLITIKSDLQSLLKQRVSK